MGEISLEQALISKHVIWPTESGSEFLDQYDPGNKENDPENPPGVEFLMGKAKHAVVVQDEGCQHLPGDEVGEHVHRPEPWGDNDRDGHEHGSKQSSGPVPPGDFGKGLHGGKGKAKGQTPDEQGHGSHGKGDQGGHIRPAGGLGKQGIDAGLDGHQATGNERYKDIDEFHGGKAVLGFRF